MLIGFCAVASAIVSMSILCVGSPRIVIESGNPLGGPRPEISDAVSSSANDSRRAVSSTGSPTETSALAGVRPANQRGKSPARDLAQVNPASEVEHEVITG